MNKTNYFINHLETLSNSDLDKNVLLQAKRTFLDYLGVTIAGSFLQRKNFYDLVDKTNGSKSTPLLGMGQYSNIHQAAFINGFHAHLIELDDGHRFGMLHLAAYIYSALISIASITNISWSAFFKGAVCGYEAAVKLARLIQPTHKLRGYHATGTCGTVGASVAVCYALGYQKVQIKSSIAAAMTSSAGLLEMIDNSSEFKPYNVGRAAMDGLQAALVGKVGLTPPKDPLGGKRGFIKTLSGLDLTENDFEAVFAADLPEIMNIYFKPYAACRHCHPVIEASIKLSKKISDIKNIKNINVETYDLAIYGHDHKEITGTSSAKMSIGYSLASALLRGKSDIESFNDRNIKKTIKSGLIDIIQISEKNEYSVMNPDARPAKVIIELKDGTSLSEFVLQPKGEPENPLTNEDIVAKVNFLFVLANRKNTKEVIDNVLNLKLDPIKIVEMCV